MTGVPFNIPFIAAVLLVAVALYILIFKRNLVKLVMGIAVAQAGVNLFLVSLGYREGGIAPIYTGAPDKIMVLPVPQALTLTSIVIGVCVIALMLSMVILTYRRTGDIDAETPGRMKG